MALVRKNMNQFRKTYPGVRKTPRYDTTITLDDNLTLEIKAVAFSNSTTETYTFIKSYSQNPVVTATAVGTGQGHDANVNVYISVNSRTAVTLETSAAFTGYVNVQVIGVMA